MADNNRTFNLVGKFDDQITKKLKSINEEVKALNRNLATFGKNAQNIAREFAKLASSFEDSGKAASKSYSRMTDSLKNGFKAANAESDSLGKTLTSGLKAADAHAGALGTTLRNSIRAADAEAGALGTNLRNAMEAGAAASSGIKDGIISAQGEANVLGSILKANALIKAGEGIGNAMTVGARSSVSILGKGAGFVGKQFSSAVKDELEDMTARGSLFGSLKKSKVFTGTTAEDDTRDYRQTKRISRINEEVIGNIVRESPVNTGTVSTLSRQLTDNLLPQMLKSRGITDLGTQSEAQLEKTFKGTDKEKGVGTELAKLYEQMATLMPNAGYAKMGAMGFTQALTSGTVNRQLAVFENNPVLVESLKTIDGGIQGTADIGKRIQILKKALEVASPTMMLEEMRLSVAGGMQSISDTLTNPNVGILSFATEVQGQGLKSLNDFGKVNGKVIKNSAYALNLADFDRKQQERKEKMGKKGNELLALEKQQQEQRKDYIDKLDDILKNANSPLERIGVSLSPVLQSIAGMLNAMGSVFMGPVNAAMKSLDVVFAKFRINIDNIASKLRAGEYTGAEGIGRLFAEIFKTIATIFDPEGLADKAGKGLDNIFDKFMKGFNGGAVNGSKYLDIVLKGIEGVIKKILFKDGDIKKGLTPLSSGLAKIFLLLGAPAFANALIMGLAPLAIQSMGAMMMKVFSGVGAKIMAGTMAKQVVAANVIPEALLGAPLIGPVLPPAAAAAATATPAGVMGVVSSALSMLARVLPPIALAAGALVLLGGGMEGTMRQLSEGFGEIWASLSGSFGAVGEVFGALFGIIGDGGAALGGLIGSITGTKGGFDGLKLVFAPLTLALQLVEMGIRGFAQAIAQVRAWLAGWLGSEEEKKKTQAEVVRLDKDRLKSQGRINAYNASIAGPQAMASQRASAYKELSTNGKMSVGRSAELREFIAEIDKYALRKNGTQATNVPVSKGLPAASTVVPSAVVPGAVPVPQINTAPVNKSLSTVATTAAAAANAQVQSTTKLTTTQANQIATLSRISTSWAGSNIKSQASLQNAASGLASAINTSAAKLASASKGLSAGAPGVKQTNAFEVPGVKPKYEGNVGKNLMGAIQLEMANKPPGSDLVIANSSETIIPAFNGLNLGPLASGFDMFTSGVSALGQLADKLRALTSLGAGGAAGVDSFTPIASSYGLQVTSGFRKGDPGWHGANRARDYSNSTGPTPQMMQFARVMATQYGQNLKELIYTPLGFSIKNGAQVAPYAQGAHYNHVHVAYGLGQGNPAFFNNQSDATKWESKMMPAGASVRSITSNTSEGYGEMTINAPITIHQRPGQNSEELALAVAKHLSDAITHARSTAIQG